MPQVAAVYGFDFTQPFSARGFDFWPAHDNRKASLDASRDTSAFRLCGVISAEKVSREDVFRLEAALTWRSQEASATRDLNSAISLSITSAGVFQPSV